MTACHQRYKREYKREVTSLSDIDIKRNGLDTDSQSDGSVIVQQIDGNAIHNNNKSLENDDKKAEKILIGTSGRSSNIESLSSDSSYGAIVLKIMNPNLQQTNLIRT